MFRNAEKLFSQIKTALLESSDLKKLIFYNTPDTLSRPEPTDSEAKACMYTKPIIYIYEDSAEKDISSFISIGIVEALIQPGSIVYSIKVSVACTRDIWDIDNDRVRPIAILSEIANTLHNRKFSAAGKLVLSVFKEVYYNEEVIGYTALFDVEDAEKGVVNEF